MAHARGLHGHGVARRLQRATARVPATCNRKARAKHDQSVSPKHDPCVSTARQPASVQGVSKTWVRYVSRQNLTRVSQNLGHVSRGLGWRDLEILGQIFEVAAASYDGQSGIVDRLQALLQRVRLMVATPLSPLYTCKHPATTTPCSSSYQPNSLAKTLVRSP
jgi:hypothetical protein